MTLQELIPVLNNEHFYPTKEIEEEKLVGLKIDSPQILMEDRLNLVKKIAGDEFNVKQVPKQWFIMITEKKNKSKNKK